MNEIFDKMNYMHDMRNIPDMGPRLASLYDYTQTSLVKLAARVLSPDEFEDFERRVIRHPGEIEKTDPRYVQTTNETLAQIKAKQRSGMIDNLNQLKQQVDAPTETIAKVI